MMRKIYPTELIDFQQCRHLAFLKKSGLQGEEKLSEEVELLRKKGLEHEEEFLNSLDGDVVRIDPDIPREEQSRLTREAMSSGKDYIYQAYLENDVLAGYPDFLEKFASKSDFGEYSYRILDTKLANQPSAANAVQLIHYSEIAEEIQGEDSTELFIVHGNKTRTEIHKNHFYEYYKELLAEYESFLNGNEQTEPYPISYCKICSFQNLCLAYWQENDHLAGLNNIRQADIQKLTDSGIETISALSNGRWDESSGISLKHFDELKRQAQAQKNGEILLKDMSSFLSFKALSKGGVLLNFFRRIESSGSKTFYIGLKTLGGERFEEVFIESEEDEQASFQRVISFIMRYLDKKPNCNLLVWNNADLKLINDLSNSYNICHEEIDSLLYNNRISSVQSTIHSSFYLPVSDNSLSSLHKILCGENEVSESLNKSPQILYELMQSGGVENAEEMISERAKNELSALEAVIHKLNEYEKSSFPVNLLNTEDSS